MAERLQRRVEESQTVRIDSLVRFVSLVAVACSLVDNLFAADASQLTRRADFSGAAPRSVPAKAPAEVIGRVLGKAVYWRQVETGSGYEESLHRLLYQPILEKYVNQHREVEPTTAELDAVEQFLEREAREEPARDLEKLSAEFKRVNDQLRVPGLSEKKHDALELRRQIIEREIDKTKDAASANAAVTRSIAAELANELKEVRSDLGKSPVSGEAAKALREAEHAL